LKSWNTEDERQKKAGIFNDGSLQWNWYFNSKQHPCWFLHRIVADLEILFLPHFAAMLNSKGLKLQATMSLRLHEQLKLLN
jgi:hypothetical protein